MERPSKRKSKKVKEEKPVEPPKEPVEAEEDSSIESVNPPPGSKSLPVRSFTKNNEKTTYLTFLIQDNNN
jgi:hypothetical protein